MLRAIPRVGTRKREWLIVNESGGLVTEFTGSKREAFAEAKRLSKFAAGQKPHRDCDCMSCRPWTT